MGDFDALCKGVVNIENPKEILNEIYSALTGSQKLSDIKFILGFNTDNIPNPIKKPLAAVNLYSTNTEKSDEYSDNVKSAVYKYAVNMYVPVSFTGVNCMDRLTDAADVLLSMDNGENSRSTEVDTVKYDSTARAFNAKLYLTVIYDRSLEESQNEEDAPKVNILVNGSVLASSRSFSVKIKKQCYDIKVYSSSDPFDTVILDNEYTISIKRLVKSNLDIDLLSLADFTVEVTAGNRKTLYKNCNWLETQQSTENKKYFMEKAEIRAKVMKAIGEDDANG